MTRQNHFQFEVPRFGSVSGRIALPEDRATATPLLFVPEDSLSPNELFYPHLEQKLVGNGFAVAWLDRSEAGRIRPARDLAAIRGFMERVAAGTLDRSVARGPMGLIGHGLGAGVTLLSAAESVQITASGSGVVPGVVTLGACATLDRGVDAPRPDFAQEIRLDPARYSLESALRGYPGRVVFVHGEEDFVVPIDEGERLYHWSRKETSRFVVMEKVGHSFGARQPMLELTKEVDRIGKILVDFFHSILG